MSVRQQFADAEVAQFRDDGYAIVRGLLGDPELAVLREVFDGLGAHEHVVDTPVTRLFQVRNLWQSIPVVASLVHRLAPLACQMMGQERVRLFDDKALVKPPRQDGGEPTRWHQDEPNFPLDRRGFPTIWVAVDDVALEQGALTFLPGSHRLGRRGPIDRIGDEPRVESPLTGADRMRVGDPTTVALGAGDATVHDGYLLHSSGCNRTGRTRRALGVRFIPASTRYTGAAHRLLDDLELEPWAPFEHEDFPLIAYEPCL